MLKDDLKNPSCRIPAHSQMPSPPPKRRLGSTTTPSSPENIGGRAQFFGDLAPVQRLFAQQPKKSVSLGMASSLRSKIGQEKRGLGGFLESAIMTFNGCLPDLWLAAQSFCDGRRLHEPEDHLQNVTARISGKAFQRLEEIIEALKMGKVVGVTRARVLSGLVELKLRSADNKPHRGESK